ncbi:MAG: hypothetical protein WCH10_04075 [bacterium]
MTDYEMLLNTQRHRLKKALAHLAYSYKKTADIKFDPEKSDDESLEVWESFAARFSRVADMFLARYLRIQILKNDPGFSGSMRDFVNQGEKLGLIDNATAWMVIRELRNITVHDYSEEDLALFFQRLRQECPRLLAIKLD